MKLTVSAVLNDVAAILGICPIKQRTRCLDFINRAVDVLINEGPNVGVIERWRLLMCGGTLVWPEVIGTIEGFSICKSTATIRNQWFEFLGSGKGIRDTESLFGENQLIDRGRTPVSYQPLTARSIRVFTDIAEAEVVEMNIVIQGYDEDGHWIRTKVGSEWIDGERLYIGGGPVTPDEAEDIDFLFKVLDPNSPTLTSALRTTINTFSKITAVIKPVTNSSVTLAAYGPSPTDETNFLSKYKASETNPSYRTSYFTDWDRFKEQADEETGQLSIEVLARKAKVLLRQNGDELPINHKEALLRMVQAVKKFDRNLFQEGMVLQEMAVSYLRSHLKHHQGVAQVVPIRFEDRATFGAGAVGTVQ